MQKGWDLDKSVVDDFVTYHNNTIDQRKEWKHNVQTYLEQRKIIDQQYADAFKYEMKNFKVTETDGRLDVTVTHRDEIVDKWSTAQTNNIMNHRELR